MADVESNIHVNIDTSGALASLKQLQRQISAFHTQMAKSGTAASAVAANQAQNLMNSINATGQFQASMRTVTSSTENFTNALEKNKLTSREYFRYTGAATRTFGRLFKSEFETLNKVARERVKDIQTQYIKMGRGANGALQAIAVRPLTLDMKNLGTQTAMAAQKQQLLNQLLKQGSTNLLNFGKNTQWAGRQLMVGFTVPLLYLGTAASKTFMKLEEQAIRFKRVYGEMFTTADETNKMVKEIQLLAKEFTKYGVAVEDTMKMAADAAAMGKMGSDLTAQVAQATRLAVLGGVEQTQALETTISVTNAFGVASNDLAKKIDFLNAVENQTVVSIEDLTIAIPKAGPVVQQLGGNVEDLAFFLTAMKEGGINASEGANALKSGLASLINPSDKASKMLQGLGINIKGIVESNKGDIKSTVIGFSQALDTLDPLNRARAIEQLFGKFQFSRLSTLFQNVTKEGTQASRVLSLANATTEELAILSERELGKIQDTTTYKFKKSMQDLKVAIAPVGEQFLKALTPIVEFVGKILDKFNGLGDGSKKFITILTIALGAIGPLALMSFGLLANGLANIIKLFASLKSTFNRAGSSTQILGQQTDYLTKEQLEASAVAASLDQVHQRLRQTFTSETAAVNALALAYKNAIAAQVGFVGPVGKGRIPQSKKYSTGTRKVPGTGNQDTVPSMLTPGEAVIPAEAAQNPANRPVIARMIAGQTVQAFHTGTGDVQPVKSEKIAFAHAAAPIKYNNVNDIPNGFSDQKTGYKARGIASAYGYTGIGFDIPASMNYELKANAPSVDVRAYEAAIKNPESIKTMTARLMDPPLKLSAGEALRVSSSIRSNLLSSLAVLPNGTKINDNLIYRRIGSIRKGILGGLARDPQNKTIIQRMLDPHGVGPASKSVVQYNGTATPQELLEAQKKAANANKLVKATERLVRYHPNAVVDVIRDANGKIVAYRKPEVSRSNPTLNPTKFNNGALLADGSFSTGRAGGETGTVTIRAGAESRRSTSRNIKAVDGITTYGKKDTEIKDVGRSNPKHRRITGVYETADGKGKVFVKPMINLENALAEQRAATILRDAHGLDVPEQRVTMVKDPVTKRLVYALESAFNPKFSGTNMPAVFSQDEYFRQLLASALRGDKDLGKGNLSGRKAPDVGTAYVYDEATQYNQKTGKERVISDAIRSVGHQALINVGGVEGSGAKKFFADATRATAASMSPDEYQKRMVAEIDRVLPKLRETISKFGLTGNEAKPYNAIIARLEDARNVDWRKIWTAHTTAGKVAITPDELVLNKKTGKTRTPKKEKLPKTVRSSGGKSDTVMTSAPGKNEQVVKPGKPPRRVGKIIIPGFSDAPTVGDVTGRADAQTAINPNLKERLEKYKERKAANKQSIAAANSTKMYGTTTPTPMQRIVRKRNEKLEKRGMPLLSVTKQMSASANVFSKTMQKATNVVKAGTVANAIKIAKEKNQTKQAAKTDPNNPKKPGMRGAGGAMGIAAGVAMMGSMVPGKVGEMSQKLMMPLMGLSMIIPMLGSVTGALTIVMLAAVATMIKLRMEFDKSQDEAIKLATVMGSGKDAMREYSKFSGKVTAGEIMQRRSQEKFNLLGAKPGKTTFGESFVQSETGKGLLAAANSRLKTNDTKGATADLTNQLMSSVMSGALDATQAKSIALNIGKKLGNYGIGFAVTANINEIIGPNGENLEKDPLKVRMDLINAKETQSKELFDQMGKKGVGRGGFMNLGAVNPNLAAGGTTALGAGIGAGIGSLILPGPGTIIGTGIGAIAGAATGYFSTRNENKKAGQMSGAVVASQRSQLEQQQEMVDSLDLYYQKKLKELEIEGKISEAKELQKDYDDDRLALVEKGAELSKNIMTNYAGTKGNVRSAMDTGVDKLIAQRYKGTDEVQYLDAANVLLADSGLTKEQQYLIKVKMSTGELTPSQQVFLFSNFGDNKEVKENYMDIITRFSARTSDEATRVMGMFSNPDGTANTKMQADFIAKVKGQATDADAAKYVDFFAQVANTNGVFDMTAALNYYMTNPTAAKETQAILDKIEKNKGKLTLDIMTNFLPEKVMGAIDTEYFKKLSKEERLVYLKEIATVVNIPDPVIQADPDFLNWQKDGAKYNGVSYTGKPIGEQIAAYRQFQPYKVTEESKAQAAALAKLGNGNKGKVQSSPLDDLLKKLRDVRMNQIKVTEGFDASRKALDKLFGGSKTIDVFSGIENDIRALGGSQDLIELVVGMDPKEYEKHKKKLFKFDNKDNIIGLKKDAKNIQEALASITLGDFNSSMEADLKAISNESVAFDKLAKIGVPVANAYELVSNKALASALANETNEKTINKLIKKYKILTTAQERAAAVKNIKTDIGQFEKDRIQEERIRSKYSSQTAFALSQDENLRAMENAIATQEAKVKSLITKGADKEQIVGAQAELNKLVTDFYDRLNQLKNTIGFMQDMFDKGFSNVMNAFDVRETALNIKFKLDTKSKQTIIDNAENAIAAIQYEIDDKEAALQGIQDQEELINKKYDERIKALDEVEQINASISNQQKGQLSLAEALTSGDIAAAARAAQEMRAQQAADAVTKEKDALEKSREFELARATGLDKTDGKYKTRKDLEEEIKKLQKDIFNIEEDRLEPAQDFIRLRQIQLDKAIDELTVLGKTRDAWEEIKNQIDLAMINSKKFIESMQLALDTKDKLISAYSKQEASGNDPIVTAPYVPGPAVPGETPEQKAAREAAEKAAADKAAADAKAAADKAAADKAAADKAAADKAAAEKAAADKAAANKIFNPSVLAAQENGIIGAASIAAQIKAAEAAAQVAKNADTLARFKAKEAADLAAAAASAETERLAALSKQNAQYAAKAEGLARRYGGFSSGGIVPKYFVRGGFARGTDTVPAMLTPGEFIMSKYAVDSHGIDTMKKINNGENPGGAVYNNTYTLTVNAKTDANPNEIAQAVMSTIKQVDSRRIRGVVINGR